MDYAITVSEYIRAYDRMMVNGSTLVSDIIAVAENIIITIDGGPSTLRFYDFNTIDDLLEATATIKAPKIIKDNINISEEIYFDRETLMSDNVYVWQQITTRVDPVKSNSDTTKVSDQIIAWVERRKYIGDFQYIDPAIEEQYKNLTAPGELTMTCGALTITLPTPEFGNKIIYSQSRIQAETRGKDLIIYYDDGSQQTIFSQTLGQSVKAWPTQEILEFDFSYLNAADSQSLLAFLLTSLGKRITLVDYIGLTWIGFIINPETEIIQAGRFNFKSNTIRFQGNLQ